MTESTDLAKRPANEAQVFRQSLQQLGPQLKAALPGHIPVDKFTNAAVVAVNLNPDLLDCNRNSLFTACMKAAQDGLLPDGREGAIVAFGKVATWMPMYQGLIKKIRNSDQIASLVAHPVYEKDIFKYVLGDDEYIEHTPFVGGDPGAVVAAYAIARFKDGSMPQREVVSRIDIDKARKASRAKEGPAWTDWYSEMARKVAIHRLAKYLPISAEAFMFIRDSVVNPDHTADEDGVISPQPIENNVPRLEVAKTSTDKLDAFAGVPTPDKPKVVEKASKTALTIEGTLDRIGQYKSVDGLKEFYNSDDLERFIIELSDADKKVLRKAYQDRYKALSSEGSI